MRKIDTLLQEIIDFGELIAYAENPASPDFQHACDLFSRYLNNQFKLIKINTDDFSCSAEELKQLQQLLIAPQHNSRSCINWIRNLFQHCARLQAIQSNSSVAA